MACVSEVISIGYRQIISGEDDSMERKWKNDSAWKNSTADCAAEEDDGRTIADMSDIGSPGLLFPRRPQRRTPMSPPEPEQPVNDRPWEQQDAFTPQERHMYALGALKAALLIGFVFIIGLGAVIAMLLLL